MKNKEESIFKTPENYFNELELSIFKQTIDIAKARKAKTFNLLVRYLSAASVLLIISVGFYFYSTSDFIFNQKNKTQEEKEIIKNIYKKDDLEVEIAQLDDYQLFFTNQ